MFCFYEKEKKRVENVAPKAALFDAVTSCCRAFQWQQAVALTELGMAVTMCNSIISACACLAEEKSKRSRLKILKILQVLTFS